MNIDKLRAEHTRMKETLEKLAQWKLPAVCNPNKTYEEEFGLIGVKGFITSTANQSLRGIHNER